MHTERQATRTHRAPIHTDTHIRDTFKPFRQTHPQLDDRVRMRACPATLPACVRATLLTDERTTLRGCDLRASELETDRASVRGIDRHTNRPARRAAVAVGLVGGLSM